jgi:hypothetical protein
MKYLYLKKHRKVKLNYYFGSGREGVQMENQRCQTCLKSPCECVGADLDQKKPNLVLQRDLVSLLREIDISGVPELITPSSPANTVYVSKSGNDLTGAIAGAPFLTINAAINAVNDSGKIGITIFIHPGVYYETFTVPAGTSIVGLNLDTVVIYRQNVTSNTTVVTMGENSTIEGVSIVVDSAEHLQLIGIHFPGTTSQTAMAKNVAVRIDNATASTTGTSNVYGVYSDCIAPNEGALSLWSAYITVQSNGFGKKRALLVTSNAHQFTCQNCAFATINYGGAGSYIGVEVNVAGAVVSLVSCVCDGYTADVSQTAGTLMLGATQLETSNAHALGFTTSFGGTSLVWASPGALTASTTSYYWPGTYAVGSTEVFIHMNQSRVVKGLYVRALTAPGGTDTDTWTIRKNGVSTGLTVTLTGTQTSNTNNSVSVTFNAGDTISLKVVTGSTTSTANIVVQVDLY